jgi:uncharacterized protein
MENGMNRSANPSVILANGRREAREMAAPPSRIILAALPLLAALLGCSSQPSRLYLLSSAEIPAAAQPSVAAAVSGSSQPGAVQRPTGPVVGVTVTVPEYLDRLDFMERTSANELKPIYSAQWGESLATTATRAVAENLSARFPSDDIMILPSRSQRRLDYQVNLDLTKFESDSEGNSILAGRWSIADSDGVERRSGRVQKTQKADGPGYDAMAAAMSRNLAAASTEIATVLQQVSAEAAAPPPPSRSTAGRPRR